MNEGPGVGNIIAGLFLILFGLFVTLLGGGCTLFILSEFTTTADSGMFVMLAISFIILGGGISLIWVGVRLMSGGFVR